jgi:hypothetical protein
MCVEIGGVEFAILKLLCENTQIVYNGLLKFLGRLLYAYLHPLLGADELSG